MGSQLCQYTDKIPALYIVLHSRRVVPLEQELKYFTKEEEAEVGLFRRLEVCNSSKIHIKILFSLVFIISLLILI